MSLLIVFGITLAAFLLVIAGMAVGVIVGRREISGSCGGLANGVAGAEGSACSLCSDPDAACKELGRRMDPAQRNALTGNSAQDAACEKDCVAEECSEEQIAACKHQ